jgi:hypothetical protein
MYFLEYTRHEDAQVNRSSQFNSIQLHLSTFEYISTSYYNLCASSIKKYTINEKVFEKHRKIKEDINNKRFPVRDISGHFRFGFGLHFLSTTQHLNIFPFSASILTFSTQNHLMGCIKMCKIRQN